MKDGFDVLQFAGYLRSRRRIVLISCAVAVGAAGIISILMPQRYTATSSILIGAPAGQDPRAATSVSPIYLESLRTYEHLASSDSLFLKALDHLDLRRKYEGRALESLKRSVLKVNKPLNTRVIEISATLEDPVKAQALAQYIAEQTVSLSRSLDSQSSEDVAREATTNFELAVARLKKAETASENSAKTPGAEGLRGDLESAREVRVRVQQDLARARAELADVAAEPASSSAFSDQVAGVKARVVSLEAQDQALERAISAKDAQFERVNQERDQVGSELVAARKEFESEKARLADVRNGAAFRGERLDIFDTGIVPQRPSSPNTMLNILVALVLGWFGSMGYLAFRYGYERALRQ